jgi:trans-aconitate 2-methyltransferase
MQTYLPGEAFKKIEDYDAGIRQIVPHYEVMLDVIEHIVPADTASILELGSGTGALTIKLLKKCDRADVLCVDYSDRMIRFMKQKVHAGGFASRVEWLHSEIEQIDTVKYPVLKENSLSACVSSLALHHLSDEDKQRIFHLVFKYLKPGGHFWIADTVLPLHEQMSAHYLSAREQWLASQNLTRELMAEKMLHDKLFKNPDNHNPGSIHQQLEMFRVAGFQTTDVLWKYFGLAVFGGIK